MPDEPREGRRDPRINVDLKILQDESIKRLEEFGKQFDRSANQILRSLEKLGGAAAAPGVGPSAAASTATATDIIAGVPGIRSIQNLGGGGGGGTPGDQASVAGAGGEPGFFNRGAVSGMGFAGPKISEYQRAQLRLGNFPSYGLSQALMAGSWMAGTLGWRRANPDEIAAGVGANGEMLEADADGHMFAQRSSRMTGISNVLGAAGQGVMRGLPIFNKIMGHFLPMGMGLSNVPMGMEAGFSRGSGLPLFSSAWRHGISMQAAAAWHSGFGLNPNYSMAQSMAAQQAIQTSGYGAVGGPYGAGWLASQLKSAQQNLNMDPQVAMAFFDPALRFGGDPKSVSSQLKALAAAAAAAHIGLSQFGSSLAGVSQSISMQTGIPVQTVSGAVQAMGAALNMDPQALSGMFDPNKFLTGTLLSGMRPYQTFYANSNPGAVARAATAVPQLMLRSITGGQPWQSMSGDRRKSVMDMLAYYYTRDPNVFGGLTPQQVIATWGNHLDPFKTMRGFGEITHGGANVARSIQDFTGDAKVRAQLMHIWQTSHHDKQKVINAMSKLMKRDHEQASQKGVEIFLSPEARRLLRLTKNNASETNRGDSWEHKAIHTGEAIARVGLEQVPIIGGPLADLIP